jgi:hypothetical protein
MESIMIDNIDNIDNIDCYLDNIKIESKNTKQAMLYLQEGDTIQYEDPQNRLFFTVGRVLPKFAQDKAQWRVVSRDDLGKTTADRKDKLAHAGSAGAMNVVLYLAGGETIQINDEPSKIVLVHTLRLRTFFHEGKALQVTHRWLYAVESSLEWHLHCTNVGA